ncbi:unnamed protein product [Pneumocystis jirovecii]|uniref:A-kinase anchor protein 7-like phosphoesterase domain-containing protein n=1 Tax=Pneumocystis jirovecii TaxID=42068 RepID=L0PAY8_PNEJI|nr:unnamed protein product [Pneumocystis jirovecii]
MKRFEKNDMKLSQNFEETYSTLQFSCQFNNEQEKNYLNTTNLDKNIKKKNHPLTHFLALPLSSKSLEKSLESIKDSISKKIPLSMFRGHLLSHLTICTLRLPSYGKIKDAASLLHTLKNEISSISNNKKIHIRLRGLGTFPQEPTNCRVVYLKPSIEESSPTLFPLCEFLIKKFTDAKLTDSDPLVLHSTILNTRYEKSYKKENRLIDASFLMEKFPPNFLFGDVTVDKICIFKMGARETQKGLMYESISEISIL